MGSLLLHCDDDDGIQYYYFSPHPPITPSFHDIISSHRSSRDTRYYSPFIQLSLVSPFIPFKKNTLWYYLFKTKLKILFHSILGISTQLITIKHSTDHFQTSSIIHLLIRKLQKILILDILHQAEALSFRDHNFETMY
jgi:hypothetical protein